MTGWFNPFLDELLKISSAEDGVSLSPSEKRRQMLQFTAVGATALPALEAVKGKIQTGKWIPKGVTPRRFLASAALGGLFWGGALPSIQHAIARGNIHKARQRVSAEKELTRLTPDISVSKPNQRVLLPPSSIGEV